jgi:hypothetical protein
MDDNDFHAELYKDADHLHGVPYLSRYNRFTESVEMKGFINEVASADLTHCLIGLFYDSKVDTCFIDTIKELTVDHPEAAQLAQAARHHISQFELFGAIGHGGSFK